MKLNEIYDKDYEDMNPEAAAAMVKATEALIKKLTDGQGWYGGASGTDLYNRDWKRDIAKEKKRLAMFKKLAMRKVSENQLDEHGDQEGYDGRDQNPFSKKLPPAEKVEYEEALKLEAKYGLDKAIEVAKGHLQRAKTSDGKKLYQEVIKILEAVKKYQKNK